jgi:hypothetical protein
MSTLQYIYEKYLIFIGRRSTTKTPPLFRGSLILSLPVVLKTQMVFYGQLVIAKRLPRSPYEAIHNCHSRVFGNPGFTNLTLPTSEEKQWGILSAGSLQINLAREPSLRENNMLGISLH